MKINLQNSKYKIKPVGMLPEGDPLPKKQSGITLVALIITVIVLLILAMVSIRLVMNGGIIGKAEKGTQTYSNAEIQEQLKLVYSEYEMGKYSNSINLQERVQSIYGNETTAKISNGKLTATINGKTYQYNSKTGIAEEYKDPFNYGSKDKDTIEPGDDIILGTEQFKVFSVTDTEILAMPYYNLVTVISTGEVKQGPAKSGVSKAILTSFSTTNYWTEVNGWKNESVDSAVDIDMSDSRNNIKQYITAYKTKLEALGADDITVRAAKKSELNGIGVTADMRNPGKSGNFWLGSVSIINIRDVIFIGSDGSDSRYDYIYSNVFGVRPIIIIKK